MAKYTYTYSPAAADKSGNSYSPLSSSDDFARAMNNNTMAWKVGRRPWGDSEKEQYFRFLSQDIANRHEIDMWNMQNEYNSPEKQMERMVAAGINPAAAYQSVSPGVASSAPGTHESGAAKWHSTADKMSQINTIIGGINSVLQSVGSAIGSAKGIQDMGINYQKNYITRLRNDELKNGSEIVSDTYNFDNGFVERIGDSLYTKPGYSVLFPELISAGKLNLGFSNYEDMHNIRVKNLNVDQAMESMIGNLQSGNWRAALNDGIRLIMINLFRRY